MLQENSDVMSVWDIKVCKNVILKIDLRDMTRIYWNLESW